MLSIFYYMFSLIIYYWIDEYIILIIPNNKENMLEYIEIFRIIFKFKFNIFILLLIITIPRFNKYRSIHIIYISLVFIKYSSVFLFFDVIENYKYELKRLLMWLFTTPALLDIYAKVNNINIKLIKIEYHLIPNLLYFLTYYLKKNKYYNIFYIYAYLSQSYFIFNFTKFYYLKYTKIYVVVWLIFGILHLLHLLKIITSLEYNIYCSLSDVITKFSITSIIYDFEQQNLNIINNIDLQCIDILSQIFNLINNYKKNNKITENCKIYIEHTINKINLIFPNNETKNNIKIELLKKILPHQLDEKYILGINKYTNKENLCVMFIDIVSYSELANNEDNENVYNILNEIYTNFDLIRRKFKNLQKIETIGDCYVIVGDLINNEENQKIIIEMINFIFEIINYNKVIKYMNRQIDIRVGIDCGPVTIGILGLDIPRLNIVGNSVNKASRLESTSEKNKIQISEKVYSIIINNNEQFNFTKNKNVYLKNIGYETTYFVENLYKNDK